MSMSMTPVDRDRDPGYFRVFPAAIAGRACLQLADLPLRTGGLTERLPARVSRQRL